MMSGHRQFAFLALLVCHAAMGPSVWAQPPAAAPSPATAAEAPAGLTRLIEQARALLARREAEQARALLAPQVRWYAGAPEFDYLLGIASLDAGRPGEAILAFERVLAVEPGHLQARAEIARAYLAVNETEAARRQFEAVASSPIAPEVRAVIDGYLERIARAEDASKTKRTAFVEFGVGWDSNVSLGSLSSQWLLNTGITVTPEGISRPASSAVARVGAGASALIPIGGGWELTAGGQVGARWFPSAHTLDLGSVDLSAGLNYSTDCHRLNMLAHYQHLRLGRQSFRDAAGTMLQWRCDVDARTQVGGHLQWFGFRFPEQHVRDARRTVAGATFARVLGTPPNKVLVATVYGGQEEPRQDVPQLRHRIRGARAALTFPLGQGWRASTALSWESRRFAGEEPLFGATRRDRQTDLRLAADKEISRRWWIQPELIYTRNASTLPPNDFKRIQALVTVRHAF